MQQIIIDNLTRKIVLVENLLSAFRFTFYQIEGGSILIKAKSQKYGKDLINKEVEISLSKNIVDLSYESIYMYLVDQLAEKFSLSANVVYEYKKVIDKFAKKPKELVEDVRFDISDFNSMVDEESIYKSKESVEDFKYLAKNLITDLKDGIIINRNIIIYNNQKSGEVSESEDYLFVACFQSMKKYLNRKDYITIRKISKAVEDWSNIKVKVKTKKLALIYLDSKNLGDSARILKWTYEITEASNLKLLVFSNIKPNMLIKAYTDVAEVFDNIKIKGFKFDK